MADVNVGGAIQRKVPASGTILPLQQNQAMGGSFKKQMMNPDPVVPLPDDPKKKKNQMGGAVASTILQPAVTLGQSSKLGA